MKKSRAAGQEGEKTSATTKTTTERSTNKISRDTITHFHSATPSSLMRMMFTLLTHSLIPILI
jgi:hypothetical protein